MSTFIASNISDGTTTVGTEYVVNGSAKAWVNFNGTGTIATRDSLNVSSLTDNGTGDYTVSFSNAFAAADYGFLSQRSNSPSNGFATQAYSATPPTAGSVRLYTNTTTVFVDAPLVSVACLGDLA